jgi:hypothetical protein
MKTRMTFTSLLWTVQYMDGQRWRGRDRLTLEENSLRFLISGIMRVKQFISPSFFSQNQPPSLEVQRLCRPSTTPPPSPPKFHCQVHRLLIIHRQQLRFKNHPQSLPLMHGPNIIRRPIPVNVPSGMPESGNSASKTNGPRL